ncbi:phage tail protein [Dactylosporangium sp. McL0621]|uniref:phage tail protein n=1 Tax=Dactylosporangium sp. McL0621 TaxID=3415678 RepID=UPI003CE67624
MVDFPNNPTRYDPYKAFMFQIYFGSELVAGMSKMGALTRTTAPVSHRVGGDPSHDRRSPGLTTYTSVTMERGVTHDPAFEDWATKVSSPISPGISLPDFRKDVTVNLLNEAGQVALSYLLHRCWVSEYTALPALDAATAGTAIQSLKIEVEYITRDIAVPEPTETAV